jgi:hypothetical protein
MAPLSNQFRDSAERGKWLARGTFLLAIGEGLMAVRNHLNDRLSEKERSRLVEIVKTSKGRPSNLSDRERRELSSLIAKAEPKVLARTVAKSGVTARTRMRKR